MDFIDKIRELSARIPKQLEHIQTEEATKTALVMPFIAALGYNVFDPTEVLPEFTADIGLKKGEKVDYAIMRDGKPIILMECKAHNALLDINHASQLFRYFHTTEAKFSILTNGISYKFFTDLDAPNKMDTKPFLEFDMLSVDERLIEELKKFSKTSFNVDAIFTSAAELRYTREIKQLIAQQLQEPSYEFMRFFVSQVYSGRMTQTVREQFEQITRRAFKQFINDQINERLKTALGPGVSVPVAQPSVPTPEPTPTPVMVETQADGSKVVTTDEELDAYYIVRAILREVVPVKRVVMKDAQSYCAILLDNNNRRPICRLYFNGSKKQVGFFNADKSEERVPIQEVEEVYAYADKLKSVALAYTNSTKGE